MRSNEREILLKIFPSPIKGKTTIKEEVIKEIVNGPAYKDFSSRTIKGVGEFKVEFKNLRDKLAKKIYKYLNKNDVKDFDEFHNETCKWFVEEFNKFDETKKCQISYGKAQKIINMTFKYSFCIDDKMKYKNLYDKCHMAIDSYILEWYINNIGKQYNDNTNIEDISWSNLDENHYKELQIKIKKYLEDKTKNVLFSGLNRFYAEFYIWKEQQIADSIKTVSSLSESKMLSYDIFDSNEIKNEFNGLITNIGKILENNNFKSFIGKQQ